MGRKKLHENNAEKIASFRAKKSRIDLTLALNIGETITEISEQYSIPKNALVTAMIKFALTNHDWKKSGVWMGHKK